MCSCIEQLEKKRECSATVHQLFIDLINASRREAFYNILAELGLQMKLGRLIKMCLNENHSKVHIGKHSFDTLPIQNILKQGDALSPFLLHFALEYGIRKTCIRASCLKP
jgi:hypothetical protein